MGEYAYSLGPMAHSGAELATADWNWLAWFHPQSMGQQVMPRLLAFEGQAGDQV